MADVQGDLPTNVMYSQDTPFVHWMVINIRAMDLTQGEELYPYMALAAPIMHMFMLFKQTRGEINISPNEYAGSECYPGEKTNNR